MATDATGNVLNVPGTGGKGPTTDDEILYSYAKFSQKGLTLLKDSGVLLTGTVLKVSATPKKYTGAAKADVGTPANIAGILRKDVDTTGVDKLGNVVISGLVKGAKIKYTDDTDGLSSAELVTLATALGGHYNTIFDFISF
jgi:hypothetical protein